VPYKVENTGDTGGGKFKKTQKMKWRRRWVVSITFLYKILGESDHLTDQWVSVISLSFFGSDWIIFLPKLLHGHVALIPQLQTGTLQVAPLVAVFKCRRFPSLQSPIVHFPKHNIYGQAERNLLLVKCDGWRWSSWRVVKKILCTWEWRVWPELNKI